MDPPFRELNFLVLPAEVPKMTVPTFAIPMAHVMLTRHTHASTGSHSHTLAPLVRAEKVLDKVKCTPSVPRPTLPPTFHSMEPALYH